MHREIEEFHKFASDAIVSVDHDLNIILFNPAAERLFGYAAEEIIGQPLSLLLPDELKNLHTRHIDAFGKAPSTTFLMSTRRLLASRTKDGAEKPLEISVQKHLPDSRYAFTAICRDASTTAAISQELAKSEARLARAQAIAHIGSWEWDIATGAVLWSDEIYRIFGRLPQEFEPTFEAFQETIHLDDRQRVSDAIDDAVNNDTPYSIEHRIVCPDGQEKVVQEIGIVLRDHSGQAIRMDGTVQDITRAWQTTQELVEATRAARQADQAKSDFLASMSHELRTPLNAVLGFAQILQSDSEHPLSDKQVEYTGYILDGGNHLLELVNQVLDLSRIEADQLALCLEKLNLTEIVADCVAFTAPLAASRAIRVTDELGDGPPLYLYADQVRVRQVLINLLTNAIKYNQQGGTVAISGQELENNFIRISVEDTGIGIAEKDHGDVLRMFHRLGADPGLAKDGSGIGLNVAKRLVEKMAGRLGFESREGIGSTFWIELPSDSNKAVLHWHDGLRVGVDAIDKDHQMIFSLFNRVEHTSIDDEHLDEFIGDLIDYTRYHFRREEVIMEACDCPDLEAHCRQHLSLATRLNDLAVAWHKNPNRQTLQRLRELLRSWLVDHIMETDTKIAEHTRGKSQEIRQALDGLG